MLHINFLLFLKAINCMKHYYRGICLLLMGVLLAWSCSDEDQDDYVEPDPVSPVTVDLTLVPYTNLSEYKFFEGEMKLLNPSLDVLPYEPSSSLFADYAHKKRFVWMPKNTKATFNGDSNPLELPVGSVLIKNFYYDNVQNITPAGGRRILETRLMIRRADGWLFANYVWNEEQTEAVYDMGGSFVEVQFQDNDGLTQSVNYRIPADYQCIVCHKSKFWDGTQEIATHIPIGIKPQNLNFNYNYGSESKNQLQKWIDYGYLEGGFSLPSAQNTVVNYEDTSKSLEQRARAYFDANCAHCHDEKGHCDYRPMKFRHVNTADLVNMGVCVDTEDIQDYPELNKIIAPGNPEASMLYFRVNTVDEAYRMPLHGRSIIHTEGVSLIRDWINSLDSDMCH